MNKSKTISKRFNLIAIGGDPKTRKGQGKGWLTAIMYLVPFGQLGTKNHCPSASEGCGEGCLFKQGRGQMTNVQNARLKKTLFFEDDETGFIHQLREDITKAIKWTESKGYKLAIRLNGTSDIAWERFHLFERFPRLQFYDYTKSAFRLNRNLPANYHLTFSQSETNQEKAKQLAKEGENVAVVFRHKLPSKYYGREVIDGDKNDLRFLDPKKSIVGLLAKGSAKKDQTGFVVDAFDKERFCPTSDKGCKTSSF